MRTTPFLILLILLILGAPATAQPGRDSDPRLRYGGMQYAEAVCFPSDSAGLARVDVFVRVSYDFMIFTRSNGDGASARYAAAAEVSSSLRQAGTTVRTGTIVAQTRAEDYNTTIRRDQYLMLRQTFHVPPGEYELLVEIADRGSTRQSVVKQRVRARRFASGERRIGEPFALQRASTEGSYSVFAFGQALPFAEVALIGVPVPTGMTADWKMRLTATDGETDEGETVFDTSVQPIDRLSGVIPSGDPGVVNDFRLHDGGATGDLLVFSLPFEGFDTGRYLLHVRAQWEGGSDTVSVPVRILWRDMPFSMRDIEFAIDAMRFILTKDEYERIKDGDERDMQRAFRRYWKEHDNAPETEHNEMMTEYFRRVDEAYYRFQTLYVRNGIQTDRGKVYVLFGPPEDIQRIMSIEEPLMEIWSYPSLEKSFRFVDRERDGNLRLMEE
ncbi:MAG: GWxTD domain-containing protein [Bacteroidetes bacterium]|nr:GWxTD domain-containing protein [Bacteroidota bacterium]